MRAGARESRQEREGAKLNRAAGRIFRLLLRMIGRCVLVTPTSSISSVEMMVLPSTMLSSVNSSPATPQQTRSVSPEAQNPADLELRHLGHGPLFVAEEVPRPRGDLGFAMGDRSEDQKFSQRPCQAFWHLATPRDHVRAARQNLSWNRHPDFSAAASRGCFKINLGAVLG